MAAGERTAVLEAPPLRRRHALALAGLGRAFETGDWEMPVRMWPVTLTAAEIAALVTAGLRALDPDDAADLVEAVGRGLHVGATPPLTTLREEAEWWAGFASQAERSHYLIAAFRSLPRHDRVRFLAAAQRMVLA